jgi:transposase
MEAKKQTSNKFLRESRARMAREHGSDHASPWATIASIAAKIGCAAETLRNWVQRPERDAGVPRGSMMDGRERIKAPERESREPRQANEILRNSTSSPWRRDSNEMASGGPAAVHKVSRNERRRTFPNAVFGSSFRNSTICGAL